MIRNSVASALLLGFTVAPSAASATTYALPDPTTPLNAKAAMISAVAMGADVLSRVPGTGRVPWTPPTDWLALLQGKCETRSRQVRSSPAPRPTDLAWFGDLATVDHDYKECNPRGLASAMTDATLSTGHNQHWVDAITPGDKGDLADAVVIEALIWYRSPVVVPAYGSWDHWLTLTAIEDFVRLGSTKPELLSVSAFDGLSLPHDLLGESTSSVGVKTTYAMRTWRKTYYYVLNFPTAVCESKPEPGFGTCSLMPYNDTYYNAFVAVFDPPPGATLAALTAHPATSMRVFNPPGLVPTGQMNAQVAQSRVVEAIRIAHADSDADTVRVMATGQPDSAVLVNGVWPSGEPWNHYSVSIRNAEGRVMAFVDLDATDGAFQGITSFSEPLKYEPIDSQKARSAAAALLGQNERLVGGTLTWDSRQYYPSVRHSFLPYYEFGVVDEANKPYGKVRVARYNGKVLGRSAN